MYIHFRIIFTSLWGHFGVTLGTLWVSFWGHFEITLGSIWDHFGLILASFWPSGLPPHWRPKAHTPASQIMRGLRPLKLPFFVFF